MAVKFNGSYDGLREARAAHKRGESVICFKCGSEIVFAETDKAARAMNVAPSIFCSKDKQHVYMSVSLRERRARIQAAADSVSAEHQKAA